MSVFLIASSFVTSAADPAPRSSTGRRRGQRARAGLPRPHLSRRRVRHGLRPHHHPDPLVRRRLGDGGAAQHRAALPARASAWRPNGPGARGRWCWCSRRSPSPSPSIFRADVDAQGGAYATGVLVLMTSAAVAVTLSAWRAPQARPRVGFGLVALVFGYTTVANIVERPDGVKIAALLHRRDRRHLARLARHCGPPSCGSSGIELDQRRRSFIEERRRADPHHRQRARRPRRRPSTTTRSRRREATHHLPADEPRAVPGGHVERRVGVPRRAHGAGRGAARVQDPAGARARPSPMPSPPSCCTSATRRASYRTSTSTGPRATRWPRCSATSSSAAATWPRSPARCSARPSQTTPTAPRYTSADPSPAGERGSTPVREVVTAVPTLRTTTRGDIPGRRTWCTSGAPRRRRPRCPVTRGWGVRGRGRA